MSKIDVVQYIEGVRVEYAREGDLWWAHANISFSAAADTLPELQQQIHEALKEIFATSTTVEIIKDDYPPRLRNSSHA